MYYEPKQLGDTPNRDAFALLYRQRVVGGFQLDERPDEASPEMDTGL